MLRGVRSIHAELSNCLLGRDPGRHAIVYVARWLTMEKRYALDDGIGVARHGIDI